MLHRQVSHNAKGRAFSQASQVVVCFHSSVVLWFRVVFFIIFMYFYSFLFLNTEPPRFSCSSSWALKKICQTRMNLSLDKLFLQIQRLYPETFPFSHWKLSKWFCPWEGVVIGSHIILAFNISMSDLIFLQPQGIIVFPLFQHSSLSELALQSLPVLDKNLNLQKSCTYL